MPPRTELPALPSSLAPLPGESLPGFLLRLSWRLGLAPDRVAELCGIAGQFRNSQIQADQLIDLPPDTASRFSAATGMTAGQAAGLTLSRYRPAFPLASRASGSIAIYADTWTANVSSRYCPQCLAEDARHPEGAFGGSWKLTWHLPVVFACTIHGRLLQHACPACGSAVNSGSRGRVSMIACPVVAGLHPHQCRNPDRSAGLARQARQQVLCGARLDEPSGRPPDSLLPPAGLHGLLRLQETISRRLAGQPAGNAGSRYFPDLLFMIRLLILSWPEGADLAGSQPLASLIGEHAGPARNVLTTHQGRPGRRQRDASIWGPPGSPAQCGALILAADSVIGGSGPEAFTGRIQELAGAAAGTHLIAFRRLRAMDLSPGLRRAIVPRRRGLRHVAGGSPLLLPPSRECLFTIEEIPPLLPRDWYGEHLAGFAARVPDAAAWTPRQLRRLTSLKLAEMAAGGTWKQCAQELGIPRGTAARTLAVLRSRLGHTALWEEFDGIVEQIARGLDGDAHRINYAARRRALKTWEIPEADWAALCADPRPAHPGPHIRPQHPGIGTVLIWEGVTQADHLHSPLLTRMRKEGTIRQLSARIAHFRTPSSRTGHHLVMLNRIEKYTTLLATQCDRNAGTNIDLNELLPW